MSHDEELQTFLMQTEQFSFDNLELQSSDNARADRIPAYSGAAQIPANIAESSGNQRLNHPWIDHDTGGGSEVERKESNGEQQRRKVHLEGAKKRRDRVREKLRSLHELLPNTSTKLDEATLLDEAAKRIKFLQSQLQTLSLLSASGICPCHVATTPAPGFTAEFNQPLNPSFFNPPWIQTNQESFEFQTCVQDHPTASEFLPAWPCSSSSRSPATIPWTSHEEASFISPHFSYQQ